MIIIDSQNRYSKTNLGKHKDDSIFDSVNMLESQVNDGSDTKMGISKSPLQLKHLVDFSNQKWMKFQPKNLEKNFTKFSNISDNLKLSEKGGTIITLWGNLYILWTLMNIKLLIITYDKTLTPINYKPKKC